MTISVMKHNNTLGVVLCGGKSRRMGGLDKGLIEFNEQPMVTYGIAALKNCQQTIINANRNQSQYKELSGLHVISDNNNYYDGPLSGMLAALQYAQSQGLQWVITVPCDAPYVDTNYVDSMIHATISNNKKIHMACDDFRQPVFSLLHIDIIDNLHNFLQGQQKKIVIFYQEQGFNPVQFSNTELFTNINTISDKEKQEQL